MKKLDKTEKGKEFGCWLAGLGRGHEELPSEYDKTSDKTEVKKPLYYILNKEIQEFLVKIKMLFLRSLEIFTSSREINLSRLDTFPTMVTNRPVMYSHVPAFGSYTFWQLLRLYTSLK